MVKCEVCSVSDHKYKCPKCLIKYCSLACYKQHKDHSCENKDLLASGSKTADCATDSTLTLQDELHDLSSEDKVPLQKLEMLRDDKDLLECLKNPHVREIMLNINSSKNPSNLIKDAMKEPIFVEFADHCLKVVDNNIEDIKYK